MNDKPTKYVSIDLETTGLDARLGKIIEFAAVIDDFKRPVEELPVFRRLILPSGSGVVYGTPFALAMNARITDRSNPPDHLTIGPQDVLITQNVLFDNIDFQI